MNTRSFMIILWIAAIIFFIPTEALADSDYSSNFSPQDTFMQVNITNGSISGRAEISLDVNSIEGADGREISLLYALYKNGRMIGIDTKSLAINSEGFSDNVTISFNQKLRYIFRYCYKLRPVINQLKINL